MKHNWHWFAGGASIILFAALLLFRLGIPGKIISDAGEMFAPIRANVPVGEFWMNINQDGRKIGYAQRNYTRTEKGFHFSEHIFMRINTMGIVQPLTVVTTAELNPDRTIGHFQFNLRSNLFRFVARGVVSGKKLTVYIGESGEEKISVIDLSEPPYLGGGIIDSLAGTEFKKGEVKTFPVFDPASLGQRPVRITFLGDESLTIKGKSRQTRKLSVDFMGMKQTAWLDPDGSVLREEGIMGIVLDRVSKEEAMAGLEGAFGSDLTEIASIPSSQPIDNAAALKVLKIRLMGLPTSFLSRPRNDASAQKNLKAKLVGPFYLDGDRQVYRNDVLTIRRESPIEHSARSGVAVYGLETFLEATPFVQSDHPKIRNTSAEIVGPENLDGIKADKLVAWVHRNLEKRPVLSVPNALDTLQNRIGDCNEHAVLLAALARAAGIPTEVETGVVYLRGRFFYHAWNVFYLRDWGGWVTADAVLGQMPADVTHIRFVRGDADRQIDLVGLIGRLKLEVMEMGR